MTGLLRSFAALWNLALLCASLAVLVWFIYWFVLRRLVRAKRIASAHDRRMLREAAERESDNRAP